MDYRAFEQRLLDTIFTSDVQLTPATIAYLYKVPVQEAADLLQQAAREGLLNIDIDDDGNLLYNYPHRIRLPRSGAKDGKDVRIGSAEPRTDALVRSEGRVAISRVDVSVDSLPALAPAPARESDPEVDRLPSVAQWSGGTDTQGAQGSGSGSSSTRGRCPFCNEAIVVGAKKCKHCHEYLDYALRDLHARQGGVSQVSVALTPIHRQETALTQWTGTQAALLSLFMPGLGQMCSGRVPAGLLWMMFTIMGYLCLIVPGFILHVLCVINASRVPRQANA